MRVALNVKVRLPLLPYPVEPFHPPWGVKRGKIKSNNQKERKVFSPLFSQLENKSKQIFREIKQSMDNFFRGLMFSIGIFSLIFSDYKTIKAQAPDLPELNIEQLKHMVRSDYSSINTIFVDYNYARINAPQGWDKGMCWHDQYLVKGSFLKRNRDSGNLDVNDKPNYLFGEIRSWDGEKQWLFRKEDKKGLITQETEHQLSSGNAFFNFAGISRPDNGTPSLVSGGFLDYLDTGLVEVSGVELVNDRPCYRIDYTDKVMQPNAPERVFWVDPGYGYAPVREILYRGDKSSKPSYEINTSELMQTDGFMRWWPKDASIKWYKQDENGYYFLVEDHFSLNSLQFNQPVDDTEFKIVFPQGTDIEDRIAQLEYKDPTVTSKNILQQTDSSKIETISGTTTEQRTENVSRGSLNPLPGKDSQIIKLIEIIRYYKFYIILIMTMLVALGLRKYYISTRNHA